MNIREQLQRTLGTTYTLERELGGGGMARVYLAEEPALERRVVVKVLPPELSAGVSAERFRREIRLAAQLQHPHIVPVLQAGESGDLLYYTMPFVEGDSLRARLSREGALPVHDARRILSEVLDALVCAHGRGIVHRDIKPENVLISGQHAVVTDFGVAKALSAASDGTTTAGMALGTPAYMAPEQITADPAMDHRADLYAVGALAYEMLTGRPPFIANSPQAVLSAHLTQTPEPVTALRPSVRPDLAAIVMRCLEKHPADRPQSAQALLNELEAVASSGAQTIAASPARESRRRSRSAAIIAALVTLAVAGVATAVAINRPRANEGIRSIAVLPFVNVGGDSADEYFSDGMADELTTALGKIPGVQVASRTSAFAFKRQRDLDVRQIGQKLNVGAVVEGTVYRAGNRTRIRPQLTRVSDNFALWSESYEREMGNAGDVFRLQEEIARSIAAALQVRLASGGAPLVERRTADFEAYELYLKGRYAWNQRTGPSLTQAVRYFEDAVTRDSNFARAYAGIAESYVLLPIYGPVRPSQAWLKAKAAADRALELDSTLVEGHVARAYGVFLYERDHRRAEEGFRRAIAIDPRYGTAYQWYADLLGGRGDLDGRLRELRVAQQLDPLSRIFGHEIVQTLFAMGRLDDAVAQSRAIIELDASFPMAHRTLGLLYVKQGKREEGIRELQQSLDASQRRPIDVAHLARVYALGGQLDSAHALVAELRSRSERYYIPAFAFAIAHTGFDNKDSAFVWLNKAVDNYEPSMTENWFDPAFESLHADPRWRSVLARLRAQP
jgi:TolB-like protein/tRNA A-37 threonylcarbamoyl transferase component Bud32/Tfp pilus assembly protein PilF